MQMICGVGLERIELHLQRLGEGNQSDNMARLRRFPCFCLGSLLEREFLELVFLQNNEVLAVTPRGQNRALYAVAQRAIDLKQPRLSTNWDLAANLQLMRTVLTNGNIQLQSLVLRETEAGEKQYGKWYLQDGSHRAIAYATLVIMKELPYLEQTAYFAMSKPTL
jgi:hypothetical protein